MANTTKHGLVELCAQHGIAFIAYAPLGGLKIRQRKRTFVGADEKDKAFASEHKSVLARVANDHGCSAQALTLALFADRYNMICIPGSRVKAHAVDSAGAARLFDARGQLTLSDKEIRMLEPLFKGLT